MSEKKIAIVYGSSASMPLQYRTAQDRGVFEVPFKIIPDNDQLLEFRDTPDIKKVDRQRFIDYVKSPDHRIYTSQPNSQDYITSFKQAEEWGAEEIVIPAIISPILSGAANSVKNALDEYKAQSDIPIHVPDKLTKVSLVEGADVLKAMRLRDMGKNAVEIMQSIEDSYYDGEMAQVLSNLEPLRKAGRIGRAASLMAGVFNVKAILSLDLELGELYGVGKARGIEKYAKLMIEHIAKKMGDQAVRLSVAYFEPLEVDIDKIITRARSALNVTEKSVSKAEQSLVISAYTSVDSAGIIAEKI
jgi:DegV family protein with EDD domain